MTTSVNLDRYSDASFRDVILRNHIQIAPSANVIQKLYHHVTNNIANLSVADVISVDGSNQGQWDLMLNSTANRLNANAITTTNTAAWSANSIISVRQASTTIRSTNVIVENLTVAGTARLGALSSTLIGHKTFEYFSKTLGATEKNFSFICEITNSNAYSFELTVAQSISGNSICKYYTGTMQFNNTGGLWKRLVPLNSSGHSSGRDWAVDIRVTGSIAFFRLVRTDTTGTGGTTGFLCSLIIGNSMNPVVVTDSEGTGTGAQNTGVYQNTLIAQVDGKVGVGTDNPTMLLDVMGDINSTGKLFVSGRASLGSVTVGDSIDIGSSHIKLGNIRIGMSTSANNGAFSVNTFDGSVWSSVLSMTANAISAEKPILAKSSVSIASDLTVQGDINCTGPLFASQITGTLQQAIQPLITTVGTLSSLTVTGAVNIDSNTLTVNSGTNRVGIAKANPIYSLDVAGDINASTVYRVGNVAVIGSNALGTAVLYSNLQSVGKLNSLRVSGEMNVGYKKRKEIIINGFTTGNGIEFCEIYHFEGGAYLMEITLVHSKPNHQNAKYYKFPVTNSATGGAWMTLAPLVSDGFGPNDFVMQIKVQAGIANFRLVRLSGTNSSGDDIAISLTTDTSPYGTGNDIVITQHNIILNFSNLLQVLMSPIYSGTMLTSCKNIVGINTLISENPADNPNNNKLLVDGNAQITDTLTTGALNFGNKWRLIYNEVENSVEMQRNTATSGPANWVFASILATM